MTDIDLPASLSCADCGSDVDRGYVAVSGSTVETAVCDTCGWSERGYTGCAPTLSDFDGGDALVRVEGGSGGLAVASVTDEG